MLLKLVFIMKVFIGHLLDTAGLRQTIDTIEQEGIKRSLSEAHKADINFARYR